MALKMLWLGLVDRVELREWGGGVVMLLIVVVGLDLAGVDMWVPLNRN